MQDQISTFIVDDEPEVRGLIRSLLEIDAHGLTVSGEAETGEQALEDPAVRRSTVVILDQTMPGITGVETAARLRSLCPELHMILCTGTLTPELWNEARAAGVDACISKTDIGHLPATARRLARGASHPG